ncbi:hypothetical protein ACHBTE_08790 [Streptomyces sp. M41]|uniref:hypothetical protein n=1 Tax=Streptomyces sp. M41 TaxID=3059412 RepID=UPI00374D14C9
MTSSQGRRDFTGSAVIRAMARLGCTCRVHPDVAPVRVPSPLRSASAALGAAALDG